VKHLRKAFPPKDIFPVQVIRDLRSTILKLEQLCSERRWERFLFGWWHAECQADCLATHERHLEMG
jgi:hypothetical protein